MMTHTPPTDLYQRDARGRTPLMHAAALGQLDVITAMLARLPGTGVYPQRLGYLEITDQEGLTAADIAEQCGHVEVAAYLRYEAWRIATFG